MAAAAAGPPVLSWTPATAGSYSYGTLTAGQTTAKTFTLANTGSSATAALSITLTGSAAFAKTADTCTGTSLGPGKTCTVTIAYTAPAVPGQAATAKLTAASNKPAATAALALAGAAAMAAPVLTTTPGGGGPPGTTVTGTATLTGGYQPAGTIEFKLYPTADCSGTPADDETVTVHGDGTYTTPTGYPSAPAGTYSWTAAYSGDAANAPAATTCGTDTVTIAKAAPAITQQASGGTDVEGDYCFVGGSGGPDCAPTADTATLSGADNPTGTIEFKLYYNAGVANPDCSGTPVADETVTVTGDGSYATPTAFNVETLSGFSTGTQRFAWAASYSGDASNNPATTGCTYLGEAVYHVGL